MNSQMWSGSSDKWEITPNVYTESMRDDLYTQCLPQHPAEYVDQLPRHPAWRFLRLPFAPVAPVAPMRPRGPAGPGRPEISIIHCLRQNTKLSQKLH